jgi:ribonuclease HI
MNKVIIYTDGGSRNNPGPAAIGVVADLRGLNADLRGNKNKEYQWSQYIGKATNNEAEYQAIIFALKKLKSLIGKEKARKTKVLLKTDSQLIGSQLKGEFKLKEKEFFEHFIEIWNLKQDFSEVEFEIIPREKNKLADKLVNQELNQLF